MGAKLKMKTIFLNKPMEKVVIPKSLISVITDLRKALTPFARDLLASGFQDSTGGYGGELVFRIEF